MATNGDKPKQENIHWQHYMFAALDNMQLYSLLRLRTDIFVVEQQCAYPELDGKDYLAETRHLLGCKDNQLIAYARVLAPGVSYRNPSIGRPSIDYESQASV
ncbi:hypothetical protein KRX19_04080 [Cardiobacteriaceae bacterium TAE3-ERU3]|nr:hypothetical protein [Cardiobacteriaceae bacterium TAE3-ERU3]